ncbi:MAG: ABC transporter ATP-binding protein [Arenicellales bacterium]
MNGVAAGALPAIDIQDLWFRFDGGPLVLENVTLRIPDREFIGVVGPNAGGKSTLLKIILGLYKPFRGRVQVLGDTPARARSRIGYVPQYPTFSRDFPTDVMHAVLMGRLGMSGRFGGYTEADRAGARRAMEETEIASLADRHLNTLSGGQLQRVLVARALVCEPRILLLDEPTSNIDQRVETDIFDYLKEFNRRMTIVVVSHDIAFISRYVQRVACLNRTLICHDTADIDGRTIQELYGSDVQMVAHRH